MLADDDDDFYETAAQYKKHVLEEIAKLEKHLCDGKATSYEDYKHITGKIEGRKSCLELFIKRKKKSQ